MLKLQTVVIKLQTLVASFQQMAVAFFQMAVKLEKNHSTSGAHVNPTVSCTSLEVTGLGMSGRGTSCCMGGRVT